MIRNTSCFHHMTELHGNSTKRGERPATGGSSTFYGNSNGIPGAAFTVGQYCPHGNCTTKFLRLICVPVCVSFPIQCWRKRYIIIYSEKKTRLESIHSSVQDINKIAHTHLSYDTLISLAHFSIRLSLCPLYTTPPPSPLLSQLFSHFHLLSVFVVSPGVPCVCLKPDIWKHKRKRENLLYISIAFMCGTY